MVNLTMAPTDEPAANSRLRVRGMVTTPPSPRRQARRKLVARRAGVGLQAPVSRRVRREPSTIPSRDRAAYSETVRAGCQVIRDPILLLRFLPLVLLLLLLLLILFLYVSLIFASLPPFSFPPCTPCPPCLPPCLPASFPPWLPPSLPTTLPHSLPPSSFSLSLPPSTFSDISLLCSLETSDLN
eukprot:GHVU01047824.1.p3 GENE.GHVU01047824.1~~GHVU01047824.1.p3  ORF type:complete len:184 (-),score=20.52 GHVU01047824.1:710-1261(-)